MKMKNRITLVTSVWLLYCPFVAVRLGDCGVRAFWPERKLRFCAARHRGFSFSCTTCGVETGFSHRPHSIGESYRSHPWGLTSMADFLADRHVRLSSLTR